MRIMTLTTTLLAALLLSACGGDAPVTPEPEGTEAVAEDPVAAAGALAKAIAADPDKAEVILTEHGTTSAEFEELIYEIAADPVKSAAYEAARK